LHDGTKSFVQNVFFFESLGKSIGKYLRKCRKTLQNLEKRGIILPSERETDIIGEHIEQN